MYVNTHIHNYKAWRMVYIIFLLMMLTYIIEFIKIIDFAELEKWFFWRT